jgi:hypothetical protein
MQKPQTPIQIFEYKIGWLKNSLHSTQINMDSYQWALAYLKKNMPKESWNIKKYTKPDDSHTVRFENNIDKNVFDKDYSLYCSYFKKNNQ